MARTAAAARKSCAPARLRRRSRLRSRTCTRTALAPRLFFSHHAPTARAPPHLLAPFLHAHHTMMCGPRAGPFSSCRRADESSMVDLVPWWCSVGELWCFSRAARGRFRHGRRRMCVPCAPARPARASWTIPCSSSAHIFNLGPVLPICCPPTYTTCRACPPRCPTRPAACPTPAHPGIVPVPATLCRLPRLPTMVMLIAACRHLPTAAQDDGHQMVVRSFVLDESSSWGNLLRTCLPTTWDGMRKLIQFCRSAAISAMSSTIRSATTQVPLDE